METPPVEEPSHDEVAALQAAREGAELCEERDYEGAVNKLSSALGALTKIHGETSPKLANVYLEYGIALLREHQSTQDVLNVNAAVLGEKEEPKSEENVFEQMMEENALCLAFGVVSAAKEHFKMMADKVDRYILCHNALGEILHEMNNFEMSAECYGEAAALLSSPKDEQQKATALGCQAMALRYDEKVDEAKKAVSAALGILKKDETANAERILALQGLLEDCDCDFNEVAEEAKNATIGTHTIGAKSVKTEQQSAAPVNVLQPRKKRKANTAQ